MGCIDPEMKVAEVIDRYPETVDVFLRHDCPDMRAGVFRVMARFMSIRWAAWVHDIPLQELIGELNEAAETDDRRSDQDPTGR